MTKTLDQYTPQERAAMVGMWCDFTPPNRRQNPCLAIYAGDYSNMPVIVLPDEALNAGTRTTTTSGQLAPRFDLPRAWNPDGTPPRGGWVHEVAKDWGDMPDGKVRFWIGEWEPSE